METAVTVIGLIVAILALIIAWRARTDTLLWEIRTELRDIHTTLIDMRDHGRHE